MCVSYGYMLYAIMYISSVGAVGGAPTLDIYSGMYILPNVCVHAVLLCLFQVLLLIHARFGFEMEAFEFLNILQAHA